MVASQSALFYESHTDQKSGLKTDLFGNSEDCCVIPTITTDLFLFFSEWRSAWLYYHDITHQRITLKEEAQHFSFKSEAAYHFSFGSEQLLCFEISVTVLDMEPTRLEYLPCSLVSIGGIHPCAVCVVFCFVLFFLNRIAEEVILEKISCFHWPFKLWPVS